MFAIGKTKPLNMKKGSTKKKVVIMACCCVEEIVDMNSPIPRVLNRNKQVPKKRRAALPRKGIENQKTAKMITKTICACAIRI